MIAITPDIRKQKADALQDAFFKELKRLLPDSRPNIVALLQRAQEDPEEFNAQLQNASPEEIDKFNRYYTYQQTIQSYAPVLIAREHETKTEESFAQLKTAIKALKAAGYTYDQAVVFLNEIKISKSGTSHPTEGLNKDGIALSRNLVAAAEDDNPEQATKDAIKKMIDAGDIGAGKKDGILDEIDSSNVDSRIHNEGAYLLNRFVRDTLKEVYVSAGEDLERVDSLAMDIGRRSWDYDSDGKNNAEGWAMIAKLGTSTWEAFRDLETTLKDVKQSSSQSFSEQHSELLDNIQKVQDRLKPVYERSREVISKLAEIKDPAERKKFYEYNYPEYANIEEQFGNIYQDVDREKRGWVFYNETLDCLSNLRETLYSQNKEEAGDQVDRTFFTLRCNGFMLEKAQPRQNDFVHARIIDNLFSHSGFKERGILSSQEFGEIDDAGGLNNLDPERQHELREKVLQYAKENGNRKELVEDLFAANPLSFNAGNGFPDQERTLLDRFKIRSFFPLKFDQGIISDCHEYGPERQKFIADLFGLKGVKHMPLHEDRLNLTRQGRLLTGIYSRAGNPQREKIRELTNLNKILARFIGGRGVHETHMMRPCSDAERGGGSGTRQEAIDVYRRIVRLSLKLSEEMNEAIPLEIMLGCGVSMQRYGGDPEIIRSVVEQELKQYAKRRREAGNPLNPRKDKNDRRILRSALAILWTEQGRGKRIMTATPYQIADDFASYITRMIEGRLDIESVFDEDYNFIQEPSATDEERELRAKYYNIMIDHYVIFRHVSGENEMKVLDALSLKATCPHMCKFMNNASRPSSKAVGADLRTEKRAIENNERDYVSGLFLGRYGGGAMMKKIHEDYQSSNLSEERLQALLDDPEWQYNIFNKDTADAQRADYSYALKRLDWAGASFEELMELGASVRLVSPPDREEYELHWQEGTYTQEQAYLAKAYYDHVLYVAQLEAALDSRFDQSLEEMIEAVKPQEGEINVRPGPKTQAHFPVAMEIAVESEKNKAGLLMVQMLEKRIQDKIDDGMTQAQAFEEVGGEAFLRRAAAAWRSGTLPHWQLWSGQERCLPHKPDPAISLECFVAQRLESSSPKGEPACEV